MSPLLLLGVAALLGQPQSVTLPASRHGHRAHLLGDKILVIGGYVGGGAGDPAQREALLYDFTTGRWTKQPSLHADKAVCASVVINGTVYAIGGLIERFVPGRRSWEVVSRDPSLPKSHFGAAAIDQRIYIVGREIQVFDTASRKLSTMQAYPGMKPGDHFEIVASLRGALHVIGGLDGDSFEPRKTHFVYRKGKWSRLPDAPAPLFGKFAVVETVGNVLYFLSAEGSYRYDSRSRTWKALARMPVSVALAASIYRKGRIYVLGGVSSNDEKATLAYAIETDRWHRR
jgi:hypothetical protein